MSTHIRITREPEHSVAYIYLVDRAVGPKPARSVWALDGNILIDLDEQGRILGIEILDTGAVLRDETLEDAESLIEKRLCADEVRHSRWVLSRGEPNFEQTLPKAA